MKEKITEEQLSQIVAEVDRLKRREETDLSRQQVQDILQQLNLPPELLDEAIIQLHRKQALAIQKRRHLGIGLGLITLIIIGVSGLIINLQNTQQELENIKVYQSRITLAEDRGENLASIDRKNQPEIYYRVTLQEAPIGEKLTLQCDWIDPNGQIAYQNNYQTRQINTNVWQTYCRHQFGLASVPGTWQVQISLDNQILSTKTFTVK